MDFASSEWWFSLHELMRDIPDFAMHGKVVRTFALFGVHDAWFDLLAPFPMGEFAMGTHAQMYIGDFVVFVISFMLCWVRFGGQANAIS